MTEHPFTPTAEELLHLLTGEPLRIMRVVDLPWEHNETQFPHTQGEPKWLPVPGNGGQT
jgi:hypothetical protein